MSLRVLVALLWKDYRVHRPILILGGVLLLLPYLGGLFGVLLSRSESRTSWAHAETIAGMSFTSLILTLVTVIGLAGSAFAAEREDRACEFLACLPTSRWMALCSKVVLIASVILSINLVNLAILFVLRPHLSSSFEIEPALDALWLQIPIGVLLFGAAWLASAWLRQSTIASACGLAAPVVVAAAIQGCQISMALGTFPFGEVYRFTCLTLGFVGFVAGCVVYLVRFEP